ncbi:hypothetical protein HLV38_02955 [Berryella wangjianweii]|uniref:Uncharacterized protein n=1 Tax=Berryella wangjianweii TaxID=2734634 RepID=A0A6M8J5E1_9ACTN|nr:hypothetical protein [Berryella wangjianweii]QKF07196.1 hypothetical protein HLV38_02955 [Berryella wangjianweii]
MAVSDAQRKASAKYRREKVRQVAVSFYPAESAIYDHLKSQPNMSGYVKDLIRADMQRRRD